MQLWNAAIYFNWLFVVGGNKISGSGSKLNCAARVGLIIINNINIDNQQIRSLSRLIIVSSENWSLK